MFVFVSKFEFVSSHIRLITYFDQQADRRHAQTVLDPSKAKFSFQFEVMRVDQPQEFQLIPSRHERDIAAIKERIDSAANPFIVQDSPQHTNLVVSTFALVLNAGIIQPTDMVYKMIQQQLAVALAPSARGIRY
jgi:hypothetical protein